jgi:hypothetical protein
MNIGELIKILAIYDPELPVVFTSSECGGFWPKNKTKMEVATDEQIMSVSVVDPDPKEPKQDRLEISLLASR